MITVQPNLEGLESYVGTVDGILQAVEDPRFQGDFVEHMINAVSNSFMTETQAAKESGAARIAHVFEWGTQQGEVSDVPLFRLTRSGRGENRSLSYMFLPSTQYVPLPDPGRYGFDPSKLQFLRRHIFQLKAIVMETQSSVAVSPVGAKKLFIPSAKSERGYFMTNKTTNINPGGAASTGGFASWWNEWFSMRAPTVINEETEKTQNWLVATGAKYVRYAAGTKIGGQSVGGQFASGRVATAGYVDAKSDSVKSKVLGEAEAFFDEDSYWSQWDE